MTLQKLRTFISGVQAGVQKAVADAKAAEARPRGGQSNPTHPGDRPSPLPTVPIEDPSPSRKGSSITLEFCRWLHENFDLLVSEAEKEEMIQQAHADAAAEVALGTPEERKHQVFSARASS